MLLDYPRPHYKAANNNYKTSNNKKSVKGKFMGAGKIIQIIAVLAAIVAGLWSGFPEAAMVIAVLGAVAGWFIKAEDRQRVLIAAIALSMAGISGGLGAIPGVGSYISDVMASLGSLYAAGSVTVILVALYEKLKP